MIVTCERCETEFQLDDARVPSSGARVRCSRCKHAFFVIPPAASREEAIDRVAGIALSDDDTTPDTTPDITQDLPAESAIDELAPDLDALASDVGDPIPAAAEPEPASEHAAASDEDESDWEFNASLPANAEDSSPDLFGALGSEGAEPGVARAARSPKSAAAPAPTAPRATAAESEDLGSPVEWDFLGGDDEPARTAVPALPPRTISIAREIAFDGAHESGDPREIPLVVRRSATAIGWLATASLCALAVWRGLTPAEPVATAWPSPAPGFVLEQVRGRWLDNVSLGRLYVVSGRVRNLATTPAPLPPLVLELRDPSGDAIGQPIPLRGVSTPEQLREADVASLAAIGSPFPGALAADVSWDFEVVAWPLPARAARFAIRAGS